VAVACLLASLLAVAASVMLGLQYVR